MARDNTQAASHGHERLLLSLVEQLSRPLVQLARLGELQSVAEAGNPEDQQAAWRIVQSVAGSSLSLVENYALSLRLQGSLTELDMAPVTVSSLLYDAAQTLGPYAKQYDVKLELDAGPRLAPIIGDRTVLHGALVSLGQVFVEAAASEGTGSDTVRLAGHRGPYGVVAGMYGTIQDFGADSLRRARTLQGQARQPLSKLVAGPATGVFVADSLLHTMSTRLHVARYHKLTGLAATLPPSQQLQLI